MFVLKSKYDSLLIAHQRTRAAYDMLVGRYNELVHEINDKGGRDFLNNAKMGTAWVRDGRFTDTEIRDLIRLCHPDKHNNSPTANRITVKLLQMRT